MKNIPVGIQYELSRALQVMVRDLKIRGFLEANDPKALEQAELALRNEYADVDLSTGSEHQYDTEPPKQKIYIVQTLETGKVLGSFDHYGTASQFADELEEIGAHNEIVDSEMVLSAVKL